MMTVSQKPDLKAHIAAKEKKQPYVNRLFTTIASRYDFFTAFMSYGMDRGWKRRLIEMLAPRGDETALDIACGTGDITLALARRLQNGYAVGLDITQAMLRIAERKRRERHIDNVGFHCGDIMRMPFADQTFACVTAGKGLISKRHSHDVAAVKADVVDVALATLALGDSEHRLSNVQPDRITVL